MKQYITMTKTVHFDMYRSLEAGDHRFAVIWQVLSEDFRPAQLIDWLMNEKRTVTGNEFVDIQKERGAIALYDVSASMDETYTGNYLDPAKCFEISVKNFAEILFEWEKLRVDRPDIILIVIHEDNHVSLETDPLIIKEYQDAGYAFDINKVPRGIQEYLLLDKTAHGYFEIEFHNATSLLYYLENFFVQNHPPKDLLVEPRYMFEQYVYHNKEKDIIHIGAFEWADNSKTRLIPDKDEIPQYINKYNTLELSYANYKELIKSWITMQNEYCCALVYRDENDWIKCQGFLSQEEARIFVKEYKV